MLGRFANGYHNLSMVNGTVCLADEMVFSFKTGSGCSLTVAPEILGTLSHDNLVTRAIRAFSLEFFGSHEPPFHVDVRLHKKIPIGGGLGGGSSDAAAALRVLSACFREEICLAGGITAEEFSARLLAMAFTCGADVPYSFVGGFAWVRGKGELVQRLDAADFTSDSVVLVTPPFSSNTAEFYQSYRERVPHIAAQEEPFSDVLRRGVLPELEEVLHNDFESLLCEMYPAFVPFLSVLRRFFPQRVSITGSGSVIFAIVRSGESAEVRSAEREVANLGGAFQVTSWQS